MTQVPGTIDTIFSFQFFETLFRNSMDDRQSFELLEILQNHDIYV